MTDTSSVNSREAARLNVEGQQLNQQQNLDLGQLSSDNDALKKAYASGDKKAIKAAKDAVKKDLDKLKQDGIDKDGIKSLQTQITAQDGPSNLAGLLAKGHGPKSLETRAALGQAYKAWCKSHNCSPNSKASWEAFRKEIGPQLKAAGVDQKDVDTLLEKQPRGDGMFSHGWGDIRA